MEAARLLVTYKSHVFYEVPGNIPNDLREIIFMEVAGAPK